MYQFLDHFESLSSKLIPIFEEVERIATEFAKNSPSHVETMGDISGVGRELSLGIECPILHHKLESGVEITPLIGVGAIRKDGKRNWDGMGQGCDSGYLLLLLTKK